MGKKWLIITEYDVETGVVDVRYYGMPDRGGAMKILRKIQNHLGRSLMGGFFPEQLVDGEAETVATPKPEEVDEDGGGNEGNREGTGDEGGGEQGTGGDEGPGSEDGLAGEDGGGGPEA